MPKIARVLLATAVMIIAVVVTFNLSTRVATPVLNVSDQGLFLGFDPVYVGPLPMRIDRRFPDRTTDSCMLPHRSTLELVSISEKLVDVRIAKMPHVDSAAMWVCVEGNLLTLERAKFEIYRGNYLRARARGEPLP